MTTKIPVVVHYEDGKTETVTIGQRELAAFEAQPMSQYGGGRGFLRIRFGAFEALRRAGRLPRTRKGDPVGWDAWDDLVDEVADAGPDEDEEEAGPTPPGQPAAV